jgi:ABC-2 type transport system permease protein
VLGAQLVVQLVAATIGVALLLATATVMYDLRPPRAPAAAVLAYLAGALALYAIGFVLAALAAQRPHDQRGRLRRLLSDDLPRRRRHARQALSASMRRIGEALPLGPVVTALQDAWSGAGISAAALVALAAMVVVASAVGIRAFRWD